MVNMLTHSSFFFLVKVPALAIGLCKFSGSAAQVKIVTSVAGIVLFLHNLLFVCVCLCDTTAQHGGIFNLYSIYIIYIYIIIYIGGKAPREEEGGLARTINPEIAEPEEHETPTENQALITLLYYILYIIYYYIII